ncbi:MAG: ABC transporter permease [Deltaproteobacteria bacterium]|nr:ABC transporter permease [Deltaproteobacteria bacterium]
MPVILATDLVVFFIVACVLYIAFKAYGDNYVSTIWKELKRRPLTLVSIFLLALYLSVATADSIRWRDSIKDPDGNDTISEAGKKLYSPKALSLLDRTLSGLRSNTEKSFSAPLATLQFTKETIELEGGTRVRDYPPLKYPSTHLFGTDKVGGDVFFAAVKGIRTGIVIGTGATIIMIPFAIFFGVMAGFFGGRVDDLIQYIYTTLSSIPGVLLIVAFMLIFGTEGYQGGLITDKDLIYGFFVPNDRLFWLCLILGITSWTGLCRLIRGETLKLRELEYVQAARAFGVPKLIIAYRHIVPNILHLALITFVLLFSDLVLAEAVLSYLGIGVGPETGSWGNMINTARLELSREPVVWWNLVAAFVFMFALVLPANIFADAIRDALDPRLRKGGK